jgi:hypothetical protein
MPSPPGSQLTTAFATFINLATIVPVVIMLPHRMKKRTTTSEKLSMLLKSV